MKGMAVCLSGPFYQDVHGWKKEKKIKKHKSGLIATLFTKSAQLFL